ncbi:hypothetical protein COT44_01310 [Candidatus Shapirobacteria bacterium CG08_land_8_20_14_0_20_39_18]|uniref:Uncharacterized protein n=1 Tax=Candidatus Shapirobacteria bacterium CG08_land_8_20_14_0_20_39_18 TaxID=1974883 RepID=A0A2M6XDM7_9BACT|nr:MAG: hypothetical protein COT44_01310 [Candidatus Shapirobacteria bacterium CG08_land_8_20_14_0_20_39_18]PIY66265.1 MAG: hypothetical protein COY91_00825 [Candidatus Shapirobacteria bacterium CG_4_10_14_0_8_um_filter_39_15]
MASSDLALSSVYVNAGAQCFSNQLARQAIVNVSVQNRLAYSVSVVGVVEETGSSITFDSVGSGETWGFAIYTGVLVLNGGNVRFDISVAGQFSESVFASYPAIDCQPSTPTPTFTPISTVTSLPTRTPVRGTPTNTATPTTAPVCQFNEEPSVSSGQYTSIGQYRLSLLEPTMEDGIPNDGEWTAIFTFASLAPAPIIGEMGGWLFRCNADEVGSQCAFAEEDRWYNHQPPVWITKTVTILPGASSFRVNLTLPNNNSFVQLDWKTLTLLDTGQILPASHDWKVGVHVKKSPSPVGCRMP